MDSRLRLKALEKRSKDHLKLLNDPNVNLREKMDESNAFWEMNSRQIMELIEDYGERAVDPDARDQPDLPREERRTLNVAHFAKEIKERREKLLKTIQQLNRENNVNHENNE